MKRSLIPLILLAACANPSAQPKEIVLNNTPPTRCLVRDGETARELITPTVVRVADTPFTAIICRVDGKWRGFYVRNEITKGVYGGDLMEPAYGVINVGGG